MKHTLFDKRVPDARRGVFSIRPAKQSLELNAQNEVLDDRPQF